MTLIAHPEKEIPFSTLHTPARRAALTAPGHALTTAAAAGYDISWRNT